MDQSPQQKAWTVVNFSSLPFWLLMIIAPKSRLTAAAMNRIAPLHAALAVIYSAALITSAAKADERVDFMQLESVQKALQQPEGMLAAWTHYITFDLFVGTWIWRRSLAEGRSARLSLLLTWWAGPMGLGLFLGRNRLPRWIP